MGRIIKILFFLAVFSLPLYFYREEFLDGYQIIRHELTFVPCAKPITYDIGEFDGRFGLDENDFLAALLEAESLWEKASSRNLFENSSGGELKINLFFDHRQDATIKLQDYNSELKKDDEAYKELKSLYEEHTALFERKNRELKSLAAEYNKRADEYEKEVRRANNRGGANEKKYNELIAERDALDRMLSNIRAKQAEVEQAAAGANNLIKPLNELAIKLNLNIKEYNAIGQTIETEFEQGNYRSGPGTKEINIYQFENHNKLVRVLAHEMGHALGVDHVDNTESIMYAYNIGTNESISSEDLHALNLVCGREITFRERVKNIFR
jgi:molecular chaperone GrpE (heat shock protein)